MPVLRPGTLTPLALVVLELLHECPRHPYDMQQVIRTRGLDKFVKVRAGSFYHTVERLQRLDLIEPVETARAGRRPERTVYAVTPEGREQYRDNLRALLRHPAAEYPVFGAAIEMLRTLDPQDAATMLDHRILELETAIAGLDQVAVSLTARGHPRVHTVEIDYARAMHAAELVWVRSLVGDIRSGTLTWDAPHTDSAEDM